MGENPSCRDHQTSDPGEHGDGNKQVQGKVESRAGKGQKSHVRNRLALLTSHGEDRLLSLLLGMCGMNCFPAVSEPVSAEITSKLVWAIERNLIIIRAADQS